MRRASARHCAGAHACVCCQPPQRLEARFLISRGEVPLPTCPPPPAQPSQRQVDGAGGWAGLGPLCGSRAHAPPRAPGALPGEPPPPEPVPGLGGGPPPGQRLAAPAHAPSGVLPAPPQARARRRGRNSSHFLCAARYVACSLPDRSAARRWGPGGAGQSPAVSGSCPALAPLLGIPGQPSLVPGHQTGLSSSPGLCGAPGLGSSPRGRRRRLLLPAPRGRPPAFCVPVAPPPRPPPTLGTPPESEFETEVGTCCVTFRQVPSPF